MRNLATVALALLIQTATAQAKCAADDASCQVKELRAEVARLQRDVKACESADDYHDGAIDRLEVAIEDFDDRLLAVELALDSAGIGRH